MKVEVTEKRYLKEDFKYLLTSEDMYNESETWYNTFCNLMLFSMTQGKRVWIVKSDNKIVKAVLTSSDGKYKTERTFKFN